MAYYNTGYNRLEGRAFDQAGYGTFEAWSYVAKEFQANGSGSQDATFTASPHIEASLGYTGGCSESAEVELIVEDLTEGEKYVETIWSKSGVIDTYDTEETRSMIVPLEDGNNYTAVVKQTVTTTCSGSGGAHSDITDNNGGTHHINTGDIQISFS